MRLISFLTSAAVAAALVAPAPAKASTQYLDFHGVGEYGPIAGQMTLYVVNGVAVGGTGSIAGAGIPGIERLELITPTTPGSGGYPYGIGWRSGDGTDTWGWDNLFPIDYVGGLDFAFGPSAPAWGTGWQFGIWNNDGPVGPGDNYQAFIAGRCGAAAAGCVNSFWGETGALTVTIPEVPTWTMLILGFAGLGYAASRKSRQSHTLIA